MAILVLNRQGESGSVWPMRILTDFIFLALLFFLVAVWLVAWLAFHIAAGAFSCAGVGGGLLVIHLSRGWCGGLNEAVPVPDLRPRSVF